MKTKLMALLVSALALFGAFLLLTPNRSEETRELAGSVTSGITIAYQGKSGTDAPPRSKAPSAKELRKIKRANRVVAQQQQAFERRLASPEAKRERAQSRTKFRGLSPNRALAAVSNRQEAFMERPTAIAPKVREGERIVGFKTRTGASVKMADGSMALAEANGVPLAAPVDGPAGKGRLEAVDLSLGDKAGSWVPRRPAVPVTLPRGGASDATIAGHLTVDLPNDQGSAQLVDGTRAFYAEQLKDTDVVIEPDNRGLDYSWVLRSPEAPETLPFDVGVTNGKSPTFRITKDQGVDVIVDGKKVSTIAPLSAWDAQHRPVSATYRIDGGDLVVDVPHADKDLAYPIVVDPLLWYGYGPAMEDNNGPGQPIRAGWAPHTFQPDAFWWSNPWDSWVSLALNNTQNQGSGWWTWHPIRQSSAFRADFYNVRRDQGNASLFVGLYSGAQWGETAVSEYFIHGWSSQNTRVNGPFYLATNGIVPTAITSCASPDCLQGGNLDNFLAFQLNSTGGRNAPIGATFDGAVTWHRESNAPVINSVTIEGVTPGQWTNRSNISAVLSADDYGIGFCSDGNLTDPGLRKEPFVVEREGTSGNYGYTFVGGCAGMSHYMPAPGHVDLRWNEGEFGARRLPEGVSDLRFVAQDMFGNRATQNQTLRLDRTAPPTVAVGGRLSDYLTEPGPGGVVPDGIRTLFGPADITVNADDASGAPEVSGVNRVEFFVSPLNAGGWGPWNLFKTMTGCTEGGAKVCGRIVSSEIPATAAGTYQIIVRAWDNAGNSRDVHRYFSRGGGEISTVVEGQSTARWVPLGARRTTGGPTQATFKWRAAAAATPTVLRPWDNIPADALQVERDGTRLSNGTVPMAQESGSPAGVMATDRYVLDIEKLIEKAGIGDLAHGKLQLRAEFNGTGTTAERLSEDVAIRLDRGGRGTDDETEVLGPGEVDLLTGNLTVNEVDASIAGLQSGLSVTRSYHSRYSADKSRLGPGWTLALPADDTAPFARVVDLSDPAREKFRQTSWDPVAEDFVTGPVAGAKFEEVYPAVQVQDSTGAGFVFERRESDGAYLPEAGFTDFALRRVAGAGDATARFELTDNTSGVVTSFAARLDRPDQMTAANGSEPEHGTFGITGVTVPGTTGSPVWTYGTGGVAATPSLPVSAVASATPGQDCSGATMPAGCQRMALSYVNLSGEIRLNSISLTLWDTGTSQMVTREVTRYAYSSDAAKRLIRVDDLRSKSFVKYEYDTAGLLSSVTEGGLTDAGVEVNEPAHRVTYTQFPDDKGPGRVRTTERTETGTTGNAVHTLSYGDRQFGAANPYDLSKTSVQRWGQTVVPYRATAIFPPDVPVGTDAPSLRRATIKYLDALGREINTAEPGDRISATELNKYGNVVRQLTAAARAKALLNTADTAGEANRLATITEYETIQRAVGDTPASLQRPVRVVAPLRSVKLASGAVVSGRTVTSTVYDEGIAIVGQPYNLPTTVRHGVLTGAASNGSGGTVSDIREMKLEYQVSTRQPTKLIRDAGTNRLNYTKVIVRDSLGREVERRQPASNASAVPTTTHTSYYASGAPGVCGTRPQWNGLPCRVEPGAQPTNAALPALPVTTFEYDYWLRVNKVTDTVGSTTRTTTKTYDGRDRLLLEKITGGVGEPIQTTKHVYDALGREVETQKVGADNSTVLSRVRRTVDAMGRVTSYEDADGNKRTTSYDLLGRVASETDLKGATTIVARTYGYDLTTGDNTSIAETGTGGIGTISASYDADGRPTAIRYPLPGATPGQLTKSIDYANDGGIERLAYTKTQGCASACLWYENKVVRSAHDQVVDDVSTGQTRQYAYDGLGRLTSATDKQGAAACVTRTYEFDGNSNRKSRRSATATSATAACPAPGTGGSTITATYDNDRAASFADASGSQTVTYDAFGRITKLPWQASGGTTIESSYFVNDLAREIWTGPWRETSALDPNDRVLTRTLTNAGVTQHVDRYAYGDDTDEPTFISTGSNWRRYSEDMTGDVVAETTQAGTKTLQVANIRGDTVAEAPLAAATTGLSKTVPVDEFGVRLASTATFNDRSYAFLGAKQRESLHNGAIQAMGARSYSPWTGRFLQADPVIGGSFNAYDYAYQDPVNVQDLDGRCPFCVAIAWTAANGVRAYKVYRDAKKAKKAMDAIRKKGKVGEQKVSQIKKLPKNTKRIEDGQMQTKSGYRVPDFLTDKVLAESKNVKRLNYIKQIEDYERYAKAKNLVFEVWAPKGVQVSARFQKAIDEGGVVLKHFD